MHLMTRFTAAVGLALLTVAGAAGTAPIALAADVAGHVYVNDNTAGVNTIATGP